MAQAKQDDRVKVHYTGRLDDGTVFDSSLKRDPLEFTIGAGDIIPGFEAAVVGMNPGDTKTITIPADEAYGAYDEELLLAVPREQFPADFDLEIDQQLQVRQRGGDVIVVTVHAITDTSVTLDANHPLAGENLTFDIELIEIV
ncbi:MAG: peptidylprolyl isomerase [Anaerolineae bacterium]|nr:peptidylprolyl isomerase [Anaerolineae bacterium]